MDCKTPAGHGHPEGPMSVLESNSWDRVYPNCAAADLIAQRRGRQHLGQGIERVHAFDRSVQNSLASDLLRMDIGKFERTAKLTTCPLQKFNERASLDLIVRCERRCPQPIAPVRRNRLSRNTFPRCRQQLGARLGVKCSGSSDKSDPTFPHPNPNGLFITPYLEFRSNMVDNSGNRRHAQPVARGWLRRAIHVDQSLFQPDLRGPGENHGSARGDAKRTSLSEGKQHESVRRQLIADPHRIPERKCAVSDQPVADLYAAIEDPRNLPDYSPTVD